MDHLGDSFIDYGDTFENFSIIRDADFYIASPDSASTKHKTNLHSPELQSTFPIGERPYSVPCTCSHDFPILRGESSTEDSVGHQEEKISDKSKRILKRNVAKERTKTKQDVAASLNVGNMYGNEMADNGDADDTLKKKNALKMKNRIAAQNSRDRKKMYTQQLEEVNAKILEENMLLHKEKETLLGEIRRLQQREATLMQENESLKTKNTCPGCGKNLNTNGTGNYDEESNNNDYYSLEYGTPAGGLNGLNQLSSPILSRFPSAGRKVFTFLTFACFVGLILFVNVQQKGEIALQGFQTITDRGLFEIKDDVCDNHELDTDLSDHEHDEFGHRCSLSSSAIDALMDLISDDFSPKSSRSHSHSSKSSKEETVRQNSVDVKQTPKPVSKQDMVCPSTTKFQSDKQDGGDTCIREQYEAEEVLFLSKDR